MEVVLVDQNDVKVKLGLVPVEDEPNKILVLIRRENPSGIVEVLAHSEVEAVELVVAVEACCNALGMVAVEKETGKAKEGE